MFWIEVPESDFDIFKDNMKYNWYGHGFHYSDTGYHILELIIEKITSKPFHKALLDYIFKPLEMHHSYLAHYSEPIVRNDYPASMVSNPARCLDII